ncbi:hypothetical protein [Olleya aquimaris]|uniref:Uncharacterized protein n=1 Tax=Olleya aquimaris TaxID=639310 RepID=A0A327RNB1_9FLAO|nr:hypothetical protein [Olleya aquimaris]RAJ15177.1 hypothetical protein LY08_01529 [Olleya aquimaris]
MKKLLIAVLSLSVFTACENEPLEGFFPGTDGITNPGDGNPGGDGTNPLQLDNYTFDVDTEIPFLGPITINTDFIFNANNKVSSLDVETIAFGIPIMATGTITRDGNGKIIGAKNFEGTTQINQTDVFYSSGNTISQIVYDDFEDDAEDYVYDFTSSGNTITKTEAGNPISTVYTTDASGRLIKKESFEAGASIQVENLTYDANGNCVTVVSSGQNNNNTTYGFDGLTNPLKDGFSDQYWLTILDDDYDSEAGPAIVQFHSTNNWSSVSADGSTVTFMMTYDADNRIVSRNGTFSLDGVDLVQEETFNYVN